MRRAAAHAQVLELCDVCADSAVRADAAAGSYRNRRLLVYGEHLVLRCICTPFGLSRLWRWWCCPTRCLPWSVMLFFAIPTYALRAMRRV